MNDSQGIRQQLNQKHLSMIETPRGCWRRELQPPFNPFTRQTTEWITWIRVVTTLLHNNLVSTTATTIQLQHHQGGSLHPLTLIRMDFPLLQQPLHHQEFDHWPRLFAFVPFIMVFITHSLSIAFVLITLAVQAVAVAVDNTIQLLLLLLFHYLYLLLFPLTWDLEGENLCDDDCHVKHSFLFLCKTPCLLKCLLVCSLFKTFGSISGTTHDITLLIFLCVHKTEKVSNMLRKLSLKRKVILPVKLTLVSRTRSECILQMHRKGMKTRESLPLFSFDTTAAVCQFFASILLSLFSQ